MTIAEFLVETIPILSKAGISTARLDALVLLSDSLQQQKSWVLAHDDIPIPPDTLASLGSKIIERTKRKPLAYVRGHQEFYGRDFTVNGHVLIPRPETEQIITQLNALGLPSGTRLLDVGTGSGAIAITAALEIPHLVVEACDISSQALIVARANATRLKAPIARFFTSDLLAQAGHYDVIAANLPYVGPDWLRSPETNYEPNLALFADDNGLALIKRLLRQAPNHLSPNGHVLIEADPRQFRDILATASPHLIHTGTDGFVLSFTTNDTRATPAGLQ